MNNKTIQLSMLCLLLLSMVQQSVSMNVATKVLPVVTQAVKEGPAVPVLTLSQSMGHVIMTYPKTSLAMAFLTVFGIIAAVSPERQTAPHSPAAIAETYLPAGTHAEVITEVWNFDIIRTKYYRDELAHSFVIPDQVWRVKIAAPGRQPCAPVEWHARDAAKGFDFILRFNEHEVEQLDGSVKRIATAANLFSGLNSTGQLLRTSLAVEVEMGAMFWVYTFRVSRRNMSLENPKLYRFEQEELREGEIPWVIQNLYASDERRAAVRQRLDQEKNVAPKAEVKAADAVPDAADKSAADAVAPNTGSEQKL